MSSRKQLKVGKFNLKPGFIIAGKYEVVEKLGYGWEGEVYRVREKTMGVDRAAAICHPSAPRT